ncbi:XdhC family protein [Erythrobacter sp. YJ-T3-07]|uniref:XdhC family protein n=1 Tax=Erythrobacter sp. YJ-T3-07 TaxID=2793063 RepID=UPI0018D3B011|nr:XdhC family protein [Erythrobacter sp. YJ-T3-07]
MTQTNAASRRTTGLDADHAAIAAACGEGVGLCTIVGIEGAFSRRLGAQLAVLPSGGTVGSLSDGCLERQLASNLASCEGPHIVRYGKGSGKIDFRLPCGGGVDILLDPAPDRNAIRRVLDDITGRRATHLPLPSCPAMLRRHYLPPLRLRVFGEGPELEAVDRIAGAAGIETQILCKSDLSLGRASTLPPGDRWTAVLLLFHDHDWEAPLIEEALASDAFYIGAQGGENARLIRLAELMRRGVDEAEIARLRSPVGAVPACKTPQSLALSVVTEIVDLYEALHDRD